MTLRIECNVKSGDGSEVKYQLETIHRTPGQKTVATPVQ
jgi:hypothetical protein